MYYTRAIYNEEWRLRPAYIRYYTTIKTKKIIFMLAATFNVRYNTYVYRVRINDRHIPTSQNYYSYLINSSEILTKTRPFFPIFKFTWIKNNIFQYSYYHYLLISVIIYYNKKISLHQLKKKNTKKRKKNKKKVK